MNTAREAWNNAKKKSNPQPRPATAAPPDDLTISLAPPNAKQNFRIQSVAVLLTYFGFSGLSHWNEFLVSLRALLKTWKVWQWCATLEESKAGKGPFRILCDGETFLRAPASRAAYVKSKVRLWDKMPAKSPDLNPVEKYWAWLRRRLRKKDLEDLNAGREILSKSAYQERVRGIVNTKASQKAAGNIAKGLRKVCKEVIDGGGIATKG